MVERLSMMIGSFLMVVESLPMVVGVVSSVPLTADIVERVVVVSLCSLQATDFGLPLVRCLVSEIRVRVIMACAPSAECLLGRLVVYEQV